MRAIKLRAGAGQSWCWSLPCSAHFLLNNGGRVYGQFEARCGVARIQSQGLIRRLSSSSHSSLTVSSLSSALLLFILTDQRPEKSAG